MQFAHGFSIFLFIIVIGIACSGCKTQQPVVVDTGTIERIRSEYQQLRSEYERLQSDYNKLTEDSKFYADYYQSATATIATGIDELSKLGTDNAAEIAKLRSYVTILRGIVNGIIEGEKRLQNGIENREG